MKLFHTVWVALAVATFSACGQAGHDGHDHEAEGHDHAAEADNHGHEGHDHDHEGQEKGHGAEEKQNHSHEGEIAFSAAQAKAAGLAYETVKPAAFAEVVKVSGRILPTQGGEITISSTMDGIVTAVGTLTDGAAVKAGQGLFSISARDIMDGNPAAAAEAELKAARAALERAKKLVAEGAIAERDLESARQRYQTALAASRNLGGLARTRTMTTPMGGFLKSRLVRTGDFVTAGQPLAIVTQSRRLQLRAEVPERHYRDLSTIEGANFRPAYDEAATYELAGLNGRLIARGRAADDSSYFVPVTFEFDNTVDVLPGAMAEVWLLGQKREGVISVPLSALTEAQGLYYVYVRAHDEAYERREVKLGADNGTRVEILSGLRSGDVVVTNGAMQVRLASSSAEIPHGHQH